MKTLLQTALLHLLLVIGTCLSAKPRQDSTTTTPPDYHYSSLSVFSSLALLNFNTWGALQVSFPYTVTTAGGVTANNVFTSQNKKLLQRPVYEITALKLEIGHKRLFYTANFGFLTVSPGIDCAVGAGVNLYAIPAHGHSGSFVDKAFVIKASLNMLNASFTDYKTRDVLGSIDNRDRTISALGGVAKPVFTITNRYGKNSFTANSIDVLFGQNELAALPELSISSNPYRRHRVNTTLSLGYLLPLYCSGNIELDQRDGGTSAKNKVAEVRFNNTGLTAWYNGRRITATPYHLPGFYLAVTVSLNSLGRCTKCKQPGAAHSV